MSDTLRISEIFYSLQGEARTMGRPTVFVRLTGCPLRCQYCDSAYAFSGGVIYSLDAVLREVAHYNPQYVTVTGGEPLAQENCFALLETLCNSDYEVSLETSGAINIQNVDARVIKVVDIKTPSSEEEHRNIYQNMDFLNRQDQLKFVICDRNDYEWAKEKIDSYELSEKVEDILFSPSHEELKADLLADWIVSDNLPVRFQIQLHKYLWGDGPGR